MGKAALEIVVGELKITESVWVPFAAALIGGALALLGSFVATWQADRAARRARRDELERIRAERAYATFFKLLDAHSAAANIRRHIDEMFENAAQDGAADMEPWAKVMEIVGAPEQVETIHPSETTFLLGEGKADLLNDVHLVQRRIANIIASVQKYAALRAELHTILVANMAEGELQEGTRISANFEGSARLHVEMRASQLNNLLGQILDALEKDIPHCWQVLSEFKEAAAKRFGNNFPEFKIENML